MEKNESERFIRAIKHIDETFEEMMKIGEKLSKATNIMANVNIPLMRIAGRKDNMSLDIPDLDNRAAQFRKSHEEIDRLRDRMEQLREQMKAISDLEQEEADRMIKNCEALQSQTLPFYNLIAEEIIQFGDNINAFMNQLESIP